ncbi:conserved hypothetical protein [Tenacibaculum dicentrarchi]|nr:conserved hypothetical protein [Tenacibaculum dicentrarchi]
MTSKEKILKYLDYKGFTAYQFQKKTGLSNGVLKSGKDFGVDKVKVIRDNYLDLSMDWLLFDEGEMVVSSVKEENTQKLDTMKREMKNYKQMYYEQVDKNMLLHEKLLACMEGDAFSKDVG